MAEVSEGDGEVESEGKVRVLSVSVAKKIMPAQ
jgi:hypothetical protein